MIGTGRDFDSTTNNDGPFAIKENKDELSTIISRKVKEDCRPRDKDVLVLSVRGCAVEFSAVLGKQGIVVVAQSNCGPATTGITVSFSREHGKYTSLPERSLRTVVLPERNLKLDSSNLESAAKEFYSFDGLRKVREFLHYDFLMAMAGRIPIDEWFMLRFGRFTSTGAIIVLAGSSRDCRLRTDAAEFEKTNRSMLEDSGSVIWQDRKPP